VIWIPFPFRSISSPSFFLAGMKNFFPLGDVVAGREEAEAVSLFPWAREHLTLSFPSDRCFFSTAFFSFTADIGLGRIRSIVFFFLLPLYLRLKVVTSAPPFIFLSEGRMESADCNGRGRRRNHSFPFSSRLPWNTMALSLLFIAPDSDDTFIFPFFLPTCLADFGAKLAGD